MMKLGLVLSGGGARGVAHLGVAQALYEEGVTFHAISGTSAGAIVGAFLAAGYQPSEVLQFILQTKIFDTFRFSFSRRSVFKFNRAELELKKYFPTDRFEDLEIPLYVTTTDISKGKVKVYKSGALIRPVLASASIPVVFDPVKIGDRHLVDGGVLNNFPVAPIKNKVNKIVASHCNPIRDDFELTGWRSLLERTMMVMVSADAHRQKQKCDVFIEPPAAGNYSSFAFHKAKEIYDHAYRYTKGEIANGLLKNLEKSWFDSFLGSAFGSQDGK